MREQIIANNEDITLKDVDEQGEGGAPLGRSQIGTPKKKVVKVKRVRRQSMENSINNNLTELLRQDD